MEPNPYDYVPSSPKLTTEQALDEFKRPMSPKMRRIADLRGRKIEISPHKRNKSEDDKHIEKRHPVVALIPELPINPDWTAERSLAIKERITGPAASQNLPTTVVQAKVTQVPDVRKVSDALRCSDAKVKPVEQTYDGMWEANLPYNAPLQPQKSKEEKK